MVFDFKQKFVATDFHEGGDSYYSKKGMLCWGAGVYVKSDSKLDASESIDKLCVEIDFTSDRARLYNLNKEKENEEDVMVKELTAKSTEVEESSMEWEMRACGVEEDTDLEVLGKKRILRRRRIWGSKRKRVMWNWRKILMRRTGRMR